MLADVRTNLVKAVHQSSLSLWQYFYAKNRRQLRYSKVVFTQEHLGYEECI
jgi:hypothetical protein